MDIDRHRCCEARFASAPPRGRRARLTGVWLWSAALVVLLLCEQPCLASDRGEGPGDHGVHEELPERPTLGLLTLGPRRFQDSGLQVGWILSIGLVTAPVTAPWYLGTLAFQGKDEAETKMGYTIASRPVDDRGEGQPLAIPDVEWGDYHALVIGIDDYQDHRDLKTAVADARSVATLLRDDYDFEVELLLDADRRTILRSFRALREHLDRKDNLLIYFAGHGYIDESTDEGYWLPSTAALDEPSDWISNSDITTELKGIDAKHILVIADSCFSGSLNRLSWIPGSGKGNVMSLVRRRARLVMTSGGVEPVADSGRDGHSVFATQLLEVLGENETVIEGADLFSAVRRGVTAYSTQVPEYGPIQLIGHEGGDFIFVRDRGQ
jgi:hypothetical protein